MISAKEIGKLKSKEQFNRFVKSRFAGSPDDFISALNDSVNQLLGTDLNRARHLVEAATPLSRFLSERVRPSLIAMYARVSHWQGDHGKALTLYRKASDDYRRIREYRSAALLGQGLMDVLMYIGEYSEALQVGKKSLAYFRRHKMPPNIAKILTNIGNVYHRLDKNRLALSCYDKARKMFADKGGPALATVDFNRANIFANMNQLDTAAELYESAARTYDKSGHGLFKSKAEYSVAYLYFLQDEYTRALNTFEQVYSAFLEQGDRRAAAVTQLDLIEINIHLNQLGSALYLGDQVIPQFRRFKMRYELAKTCYFVAIAHMKLGELTTSSKYLARAEKLYRRENNSLWRGMVSMAYASISLQRGQSKRAIQRAESARSYFLSSGDKRRSLDATILAVKAGLQNGKGHESVRSAKRLLRRQLATYQEYEILTSLGKYFNLHHDYENGLKYFRSAAKQVEKMLSGIFPDDIRFFFLIDKTEAYNGMVESLIHLRRYESSLLQSFRALALLNSQKTSRPKFESGIPQNLLNERTCLRASLRKLIRIPTSDQRHISPDSGLFDQEQQLWSVERRIRAHVEKSARYRLRTTEFTSAKKLARRGETIVHYVNINNDVHAICTNSDEVGCIPLEICYQSLRAKIWEYYFLAERAVYHSGNRQPREEAQFYYLKELYDLLIKPLTHFLEVDRLIFVVDGIFAQVPFVALCDDEMNYLTQSHQISTVFDPEALFKRGKAKIDFAETENAIFGVPSDYNPAVTIETYKIKSVMTTSAVYLGAQANHQNLINSLTRVDGFVHIAAHASRSSENPLFSQIHMSDGPIYTFDLVASGCQTAAPGLYYGNAYSLAKSFYQAGAKYVIGTLWSVSDRFSAAFMTTFYESLADEKDINSAFHSAVRHFAGSGADPALWSAFVLYGL